MTCLRAQTFGPQGRCYLLITILPTKKKSKSVEEKDRPQKFANSKAIVVLRTVKGFAKQSFLYER